MEFNCYKYTDLIDLLSGILEFKKNINPMFSLRAWTSQLGYKYPSYLSQCLRRERTVNIGLIQSIFEKGNFSKKETEYITFLYLIHNSGDCSSLDLDGMFSYFDRK